MKRSQLRFGPLTIVVVLIALVAAALPALAQTRDVVPSAERDYVSAPFQLSEAGGVLEEAPSVAASGGERPVFLVVWRTRGESPRVLGRVAAVMSSDGGPQAAQTLVGAIKEIRLSEGKTVGRPAAAYRSDGEFQVSWAEPSKKGVDELWATVVKVTVLRKQISVTEPATRLDGGGSEALGMACAADGWCLEVSDRDGEIWGTFVYRRP